MYCNIKQDRKGNSVTGKNLQNYRINLHSSQNLAYLHLFGAHCEHRKSKCPSSARLEKSQLKPFTRKYSVSDVFKILFLQYFCAKHGWTAVATFPSGLSFKCVSLTRHCQLPSWVLWHKDYKACDFTYYLNWNKYR